MIADATAASTPAETVIRLDDVRKVYATGAGPLHALAGVSLDIRRGSFWAIMGPSGSGKSTLLNILGCLDRPSSGAYILDGRDVSALDDDALSEVRLRRIGFVFQSFNLIPQLTVRENIALPFFYMGVDDAAAEGQTHRLAERVGLSARLDHRPAQLSGGEQQRVAVARSMANSPSVVLADEPTGNLDSAMGRQIMELFAELNREGTTIILVTHEPDVAECAGACIHMRDGRVERIGAVR